MLLSPDERLSLLVPVVITTCGFLLSLFFVSRHVPVRSCALKVMMKTNEIIDDVYVMYVMVERSSPDLPHLRERLFFQKSRIVNVLAGPHGSGKQLGLT
jgi:hypothetical protein